MKRLVLIALLAAASAAPVAAAKFTMQLAATPTQSIRMQSGVAAIDNTGVIASVRLIQAEGDLKKRGAIQLVVMNQGGTPFNFGPENVSAKLADGTPVAIIFPEQLVREEKRRQTWARVGAALAASSNSSSASRAGQSSGMMTYHGSTNGTFGRTPFNSTTTGSAMINVDDPAAREAARARASAENARMFANLAERNASRTAALQDFIRTTTIDPQQLYGGAVTFELPKSVHQVKGDVPMTFVVTLNGEAHTFNAMLRRW